MRRLAAVVLAASSVAVLGGDLGAGRAAATASGAAGTQVPPHRAAVIVDTGTEVKSVCVRFAEESISGVEALQRAAVDPVLRAFPGKGSAVCSLCGTGCPADESCLTCDPDGRFWGYSRAPAGTTSLRLSGVGASSTAVRDGDVEGWRWGTGGTPPFAPVEQVCGEAAPATAPVTTAVATSATTAPTTAPVASVPGAAPALATTTTTTRRRANAAPADAPTAALTTTSAAPAAVAPPSSAAPLASTATSTTTAGSGELAAATRSEDEGGDGGGSAGLAAFAAVLTALVAWGALARKRRHRTT